MMRGVLRESGDGKLQINYNRRTGKERIRCPMLKKGGKGRVAKQWKEGRRVKGK